jgi:hypothetical protein
MPLPIRSSLHEDGFRLEVFCRCGVTFERWITPHEADEDLLILARMN